MLIQILRKKVCRQNRLTKEDRKLFERYLRNQKDRLYKCIRPIINKNQHTNRSKKRSDDQ